MMILTLKPEIWRKNPGAAGKQLQTRAHVISAVLEYRILSVFLHRCGDRV